MFDHINPVRRIYERELVTRRKKDWQGKEYDSKEYVSKYKGMVNPHFDMIENAMPSCAKCNINKHGFTIEEFREAISGYLNSLNSRFVQYQMVKRYGLIQETGIEVKFYFETLNPQ